MKKSDASTSLRQLILVKESEYRDEGILLKNNFHQVFERLKPVNIIKNTFKELISSPDLKTNLVDAAIGFTTGVVTRKVLVGKTVNPLKKLFGAVLEMVVASEVAKNAGGIKSIGIGILKKLIQKKQRPETV